MFSRFDRIHERDGQTDTHTDIQTPHNGMGSAYTQQDSYSCRFESFSIDRQWR